MSGVSPDRLRQVAAWADELTPDEVARAAAGITERTVLRGAYLFHYGDQFDYWSGLESGLLKMGAVASSGKAIAYAGVGTGGWFGEGSVIKNEPRRYDMEAIRESQMALMNRATFMWLFENSVGFNRFLVRQMNERLGLFIALVGHDRMLDAKARVARCIAWLFNPVLYPAMQNHLDITQEELGSLAGISRQAANRSIRQLHDEGLIRIEGDRIHIRHLEGLNEYGE